jgi:hypothetical protein
MPPATTGWQQQAGKPQPQIPFTELSPDSFYFFLSLFLPLMRKQPKYTCMMKNLLELYCIWTWDTLLVFVFCFCFFVQFCSTLCISFDETTTEQHLRHHLQDLRLRRTPKLLRLKLHCIWTWRVFIYLFFIIYFSFCFILFIYIYFFHLLIFHFYSYLYSFIFYFQSSLCLSNACSAYCRLVH